MRSLSPPRRLSLALVLVAGTATLVACHRDTGTTALTSASSAPPSAASPAAISDADISAAVSRRLKEDNALRSMPITVAVTNGICTLTGSVGSVLAKERALHVAQTLRGIRSIVDRVQIVPVGRSDDLIKHDVLDALKHESATRMHPVAVTVNSGAVTLTGTAPSWSERMFYADIAKTAAGVKAIDNQITVAYDAVPSDAAIATAARRRIADDVWLDGSNIAVTVNGRTAVLKGVVGSVADKARALDAAWSAGAAIVEDDGLTVDWAARDGQRSTTDSAYRSDDQIASAVGDAFKLDPRLDVLEPKVAVKDGDVELTGTVDSVKAKQAAMLDAKDTVGVGNVRDRVVVQPPSATTDADIDRAVKRALSADSSLSDAPTIHSSTAKGKVVLEGNADSASERFYAVQDAASVPGVSDVDDQIAIKLSPQQIKTTIEDRLFWDATIQRDRVLVAIAPDGTATLNGTVDSWAEVRAAADDATLGGATHVINLLQRKGARDR